ncbi:hypothetical protein ACWIID_10810 [Streptomyces phaeochromogenes]
MGADGVLQIYLTRYIADMPDDIAPEPEALDLHLMAIDPPVWAEHREKMHPRYGVERDAVYRRSPESEENDVGRANVIVTAAKDQPPLLVLDETMHRFPHVSAIGVITRRVEGRASCLVGLRTRFSHYMVPGATKPCDSKGYVVTMTAASTKAGPLLLYPSALLGWARWWTQNATVLSDRERYMEELPPPPLSLDVTEAWRTFRIDLSDPELTRWPAPPPPPMLYGAPDH